MPAIDVHTHMLGDEWLKRIEDFGGPESCVTALKSHA